MEIVKWFVLVSWFRARKGNDSDESPNISRPVVSCLYIAEERDDSHLTMASLAILRTPCNLIAGQVSQASLRQNRSSASDHCSTTAYD